MNTRTMDSSSKMRMKSQIMKSKRSRRRKIKSDDFEETTKQRSMRLKMSFKSFRTIRLRTKTWKLMMKMRRMRTYQDSHM